MRITLLLFCFLISLQATAATEISVFANNGLANWEEESFEGQSTYNIVKYGQRTVLKAESNNSASGLVLKKRVDLLKTPYIQWDWLTTSKLSGLNEQAKPGDDYVARIYVVIDGGFAVWSSKCLSYVWSSNQAQGTVWNNAFIGDRVRMIAVRGEQDNINQWYQEKRNVYQDLIDQFGDKGSEQKNQKAYRYIDVIAIMTDTDNSGRQAESYYGDISFSAQ
ncbi:DUF3047 domain-containing protein [Psychromonas sp. 14N.309.X.WAT.B.A12]|uniref:DUF3047 domain-containing protein n=1 Tax=Psychromonas sp. 14N.309.X.WAT.B.A12 TaxID=2998322 RepID=UPI0025B0D67B|nr:DUF3047 domain-containing protein [Psychromonas sp. 14N.309.X.WAT.B.A12]MDN2663586.1 DUF3047 domain-containing protein [Psychromonas sp. 14N.309.X.WAT.B.A12]